VSSPNWFVRHWRGEASLGVAFWLNWWLIANLLPKVLIILYALTNPLKQSLRTDVIILLIVNILQWGLWVWGAIGVIRSVDHHTSRGGRRFWANAASITVWLSVVLTLVRIPRHDVPAMAELVAIAVGHDPIKKVQVERLPDGTSILLEGTIGEGSASATQEILNSTPKATALILDSRGGRLAEAREIAEQVSQRQLDTKVQHQCLSACTFIFLAGVHRDVSQDAKLGFHQPSFPGLGGETKSISIHVVAKYYRSAGLKEWFIDRIISTEAKDMWIPSQTELRDAGVTTPPP
jgi:ATP-dependent protease ClpP protease subunit